MTVYHLYLESGPRRRKTMVHVFDLLGCIAQGATTEVALAATPAAIRRYGDFLARHGEVVIADESDTTEIVQHVTEGMWLGNGDPTPGFYRDFQPLAVEDLQRHLRHLVWLREDLLQVIRALPHEQVVRAPPAGGRSVAQVIAHIAESQCVYVRYLVGKVDGFSAALRAVQQDTAHAADALAQLWDIAHARLARLTDEERVQLIPHGQVVWSAHRALRRLLEHDWEHLVELSDRLASIDR